VVRESNDCVRQLVVSTPGAKDILTRDREFVAFKGFPICVTTSEPLKKKDGPTEFRGTLHERSDDTLIVNAKGRMIKIPRDKVCVCVCVCVCVSQDPRRRN